MYATYLIIGITCVISFLGFKNEKLISDLILWPPAISRGKQYYRLLTYGFIGNPAYRSLGASGAVSAVLFAFVLLQPWATILIFFIPCPAIIYAVLYIAYSIYMDRQNKDNVNHSAHLWGAAYGVLFLLAMEPRLFGAFLERLSQPTFM